MLSRAAAGLAVGVALSLSAVAFGQTASTAPPRAAQAPVSGQFVAIGCISRQGPAASPRYLLTDMRGGSPTVYRLNGDAAQLAQHVGHTVEVSGPLATASLATAQRALKVSSLVWIASSCRR